MSKAVTKSNRTVNAHGLMPSISPATTTAGNVIAGRYACIAWVGAAGCPHPATATAPTAAVPRADTTRMRRSGTLNTAQLSTISVPCMEGLARPPQQMSQ